MVWDRSVLEKLSAGKLVKICQNNSEDVSECLRFEDLPTEWMENKWSAVLILKFNFFQFVAP